MKFFSTHDHSMAAGGRSSLVMLLIVAAGAASAAAAIHSDEEVVLFPTAAVLSEDGKTWRVPVHGWVFEPEHDDLLRNQVLEELHEELEEELGIKPDLPAVRIFDDRIRWFLVDNERGKDVQIRVGGRIIDVGESDDDGHFTGSFTISADDAAALQRDEWLPFEVVLPDGDPRHFRGQAKLESPIGVTVVSDIDDTIKVTQVRSHAEVVLNTFCRPCRAVPGMAAKYTDWAARGASIHYVTSSPYQLYPMLSEFTRDAHFPGAVWHAKRIRVRDRSVLKLFDNPLDSKKQLIEPQLKQWPGRKFILVGDSGEKDPEIYADLARRYPAQVIAIYIRDVTNEPPEAPRYRQTFRDVPPQKWRIFADAATLRWPE